MYAIGIVQINYWVFYLFNDADLQQTNKKNPDVNILPYLCDDLIYIAPSVN